MDKRAADVGYSAPEDTLGGRIYRAREAAGLTVDEASRRVGVLGKTWNYWERDRDVPRANRLANMAGILGVSLGWLLSGTGNGPADEASSGQEETLIAAFRDTRAQVTALNRRLETIASAFGKLSGPKA